VGSNVYRRAEQTDKTIRTLLCLKNGEYREREQTWIIRLKSSKEPKMPSTLPVSLPLAVFPCLTGWLKFSLSPPPLPPTFLTTTTCKRA